MHRLFFLPQLRGVPLPSRILCGRSPPGSWKGRRPDQDAVEDPAPESWPTAAGADQAAQAAAGRLRAPGESRCHYVHSQEDESGRGRLRPSRIHAGSWKASGRIGKTREIQRRKAGRRQRAQIRPLRLPQAVSERRESPAAIMSTVRKMKAAEGVSGRRGSRREAGRLQAGQKGQATARIPQLSRIHAAGKTASGSGRRSDRADRLLFISTTYQLPLFSPLD